MPANTLLTVDKILKECYPIAHQKSNFIMRTNRQYDSQFANKGAQAGQALRIRLPPKYKSRVGNVMSTQAAVDRAVTLPLATIRGIDLDWGQEELSYKIEEFVPRYLEPAMTQLMAEVEDDAFTMYKDVYSYSGAVASAITFKSVQQARQYMSEQLAPPIGRTMCYAPQAAVDFADATKTQFHANQNLEDQMREGNLGRIGMMDHYENTLTPPHTVGTYGGTPLVNGASQGSTGANNAYAATTALITDGWTATTTTLNKGDIITLAGVNDVHPETKKSYGRLKRFVVVNNTTTDGSGNSTITISPAIITGGAYQTVTAAPADNAAIVVLGASASTYGQSLAFQENAFVFVTADLQDPSQFGAWGGVMEQDGFSIRLWRQGDIVNGTFPTRLDIAYGFVSVYPEWAARQVYLQA